MGLPGVEQLGFHALYALSDGIIITDSSRQVFYLNKKAEDLTGWKNNKGRGKALEEILFLYEEDGTRYLPPLADDKPLQKTPDYLHLRSQTVSEECHITGEITSFVYSEDRLPGLVFTFRDVTEQKRKESEIRHNAFHDSLTGLYNRVFFEEEMKRLSGERMLPLSVIMADANGLKLVNDAFGHVEGDTLLKKIAMVLSDACRKEDIIARIGGDEFAIPPTPGR